VRRDARGARADELALELQRARAEIQSTREEMQTSQEELKSTNEELQSTNEELQSTNEELTTSKEEMQSMNEELQTVNQELQAKVDELSRTNNDMKNLLNSTEIATLFLDSNLSVRRFTTPTANLIKLIPTDVGRPVDDIVRAIDYPDLLDDCRAVIETLVFRERTVAGPHHRWFAVRIMPYRTLENVIDGVVITFTDASARKSAESELKQQTSDFRELRELESDFRQMTEAMPNFVLGCTADGTCDYVGARWPDYTGLPASAFLGRGWLDAVDEQDRARVRQIWGAAIASGNPADFEFRLRSKNGAVRWFKARAAPVRDPKGKIVKWYASCLDVDDLKQAAEQGRSAIERSMTILEHVAEPFFALTAGGTVAYVNHAAARLLGRKRQEVLNQKFFQVLPQTDTPAVRELLEKVLRDKREASLVTELGHAPLDGQFAVRMFPSAENVGVLLQRN
jgi:two-component system CheB/CheR fusion protein